MAEEKEKSSWAPPEEERIPVVEQSADSESPFFKLLARIDKGIGEVAEAMCACSHQLCRIADRMGAPDFAPKAPPAKTVSKGEKPPKTEARAAPRPAEPEPPTPGPVEGPVDLVKQMFPDDLAEKLEFSVDDVGKVRVDPTSYLGSENFAKIASIVREAGGKYVSEGKTSHFKVPPMKVASSSAVEKIEQAFPPVLADMLTFEEDKENNRVVVRAKTYLGSDNFGKIARVVRDVLGGEYVSAGRESHFRVPVPS